MINIYLTITANSRVRDLLRLGTLDYLLEDPEVRVVLVTQAYQDQEFVEEFASERVLIRDLKPFSFNRRKKALVMYRWSLRRRRLVDAWMWLEDKLFPSNMYDAMFQELPPSLVVLADAIKEREIPLALNARRRKIPTLGLIRSWDNILKRLAVRADVLAVPNQVNRREAMELELYRDSEVIVTGTPQFDSYFQGEIIKPRAQFLGELGLDPSQRLILLATAGAKLEFVQASWLDLLLKAQENGEFVTPTQLVCRNHSGDSLAPFLDWKYANREGLFMDLPRRCLGSLGPHMTREDVAHVANLLRHADVVVSPASTMLLEAAIFDTPAVIIAFNDVLPEVTNQALLDFTFKMHYKPLIENNLLPVAYSREDLISWINRLLEQPQLYREERQRIVDSWIKPSDGNSSRRVAHLILQMAHQATTAKSREETAEKIVSQVEG